LNGEVGVTNTDDAKTNMNREVKGGRFDFPAVRGKENKTSGFRPAHYIPTLHPPNEVTEKKGELSPSRLPLGIVWRDPQKTPSENVTTEGKKDRKKGTKEELPSLLRKRETLRRRGLSLGSLGIKPIGGGGGNGHVAKTNSH